MSLPSFQMWSTTDNILGAVFWTDRLSTSTTSVSTFLGVYDLLFGVFIYYLMSMIYSFGVYIYYLESTYIGCLPIY